LYHERVMNKLLILPVALALAAGVSNGQTRPRVRESGIVVGVLAPGPLNAITDVQGVKVGHVTLINGASVRTGVTAIVPHGGNVFREKVPAGIAVANGFGKLTGFTQVEELATIETPIILTNTLNVPEAAAALIDYTLTQPGNESVQSVNPVVGETNDGWLNDIRGRHVIRSDVLRAIAVADSGPVAEGAVGAGTGTTCFGFKGGIGTASRRLDGQRGGFTVGVLVQTNFGGVLTMGGLPVGELLKEEKSSEDPKAVAGGLAPGPPETGGSCLIVVATDAPLDGRNLRRLARRALIGIARTGGYYSHGSGDYAVAFSTDTGLRVTLRPGEMMTGVTLLRDERISPLFQAAAEAAEEAILNSLFKAETMTGYRDRTARALPLDRLFEILEKAGRTTFPE